MRVKLVALMLMVIFAGTAAHGGATHVSDDKIPWGCPAPDCIPAITTPRFTDESYLRDDELVIGVSIDGDARAYPVKVLDWHEIVDDTVGGKPLAVTYCPLCGSAVAYERTVQGQILTFAVSGRLYKNDLVMYDRETGTLWAQIPGEGIRGVLHGVKLQTEQTSVLTWGEWRSSHPATKLLALPDTYPSSQYDRYPYGSYRDNRQIGISGRERSDVAGLHPKAFVAGIQLLGEARAYTFESLSRLAVVNDTLGGVPNVVALVEGEVHAYERGDRQFVAGPGPGNMVDGSGRIYGVRCGCETYGGEALQRVDVVNLFWFAWYDFHPDTTVFNASGEPFRPTAGPRETSAAGPFVTGFALIATAAALALFLRGRSSK